MSEKFQIEVLKAVIAALEHERSSAILSRELGMSDSELDTFYENCRFEFDLMQEKLAA